MAFRAVNGNNSTIGFFGMVFYFFISAIGIGLSEFLLVTITAIPTLFVGMLVGLAGLRFHKAILLMGGLIVARALYEIVAAPIFLV